MHNNSFGIDFPELFKRIIKYIIEAVVIAIAAFTIPKKKLNTDEIGVIALCAAVTLSLLDTFLPSMASTTRTGVGLGIGAKIVGY